MKFITKDIDYAFRALSLMAKKDGIVSVSELYEELKISKPYLRSILQKLNRAGILKSYKGKGGGFTLAVSTEDIRLSDIMQIFKGNLKLSECLIRNDPCPDISHCLLKNKINQIKDMVDKELHSTTLESIILR